MANTADLLHMLTEMQTAVEEARARQEGGIMSKLENRSEVDVPADDQGSQGPSPTMAPTGEQKKHQPSEELFASLFASLGGPIPGQ